jgi:two-component system NtrC family sensor kinase
MAQKLTSCKLAILIVSLLISFASFGQNRDVLNYDVVVFPLETNIIAIQELITAQNKDAYLKPTKVVSIESSKKPLFVKLKLQDSITKGNIALQISNPTLDNVTLYRVIGNQIDSIHISELDPTEGRLVNDQNFIFPLKAQDSYQTLYLKITSSEQLLVPIEINTLETIADKNKKRDNAVYFYFGIMLVMFMYNLFLFANTKDRNYFLYILYILFVALTQITLHGFLNRYLGTSFNYFKGISIHVFGALSGITTIIFVTQFIEAKKYIGKLNAIVIVIITVDVIAIFLCFVNQRELSYNLINITAGLGAFAVLLISAYVAYKGNRSAVFFLIAWSLFLTSIIIFVLKDFGIVSYNGFTRYVLLYGSALEVTFLSFALADRINLLKKEKAIAQAEALLSAQENARIIQEQNTVLEQKVIERTKEITETNNNLFAALNNLKQTQTQLVESEKMASLGQLTAGIAHEINNPINFVTSNVKPLQRDINVLYELQEKTEELILNKQANVQMIHELKQSFDFDYLKKEIDYLIKGIHEGSSRTAEIVKGLRIFSRVDEDDIKLASINEGLDSTIIIVNNQLNNRIEINRNYANLEQIECFPGKLNQVFLNLISNGIYAVKQKFDDNPGGVITIETKESINDVSILITDNGTGMDENTRLKLFEPFFTTKPVGEGTGLGLSIVYNTIKKHHGNITVISEIGMGTTFTITIPKKHSNG